MFARRFPKNWPASLAIVCLLMAGCHHCGIHTEMVTCGRLVNDTPPASNASKVYAQPVPGGGGDCDAPKLAIIDVDGLLSNVSMAGQSSMGENPVSLFRERLDAAGRDPAVRAVVVRIHSYGGSVGATDTMWNDLLRFREQSHLPVVACLLDVGAGGAYYLATAADAIVAHPTTVTGGIGVIFNRYNFKESMEGRLVFSAGVKSGPYIDMGMRIKPVAIDPLPGELPPPPPKDGEPVQAEFPGERIDRIDREQKEMLQAMANDFHAKFIRDVQRMRPNVDPALKTNFDGRVFTAPDALDRGFIDRIGYLDDALDLAREMAGLPFARVVLYHRCNDRARSIHSITPNVPMQGAVTSPLGLPGGDRSRAPEFLYLWQPEPTMEKLKGI